MSSLESSAAFLASSLQILEEFFFVQKLIFLNLWVLHYAQTMNISCSMEMQKNKQVAGNEPGFISALVSKLLES